MEYVISRNIESAGKFEYYLTKKLVDGVVTYGVAIKSVKESLIEEINDLWTEKEPVLHFVELLAANQVTCVHLRQLCEEFVEELYSI